MPISHATSYHRYFTCTNDIWNLENKHAGLHPSLTTKGPGVCSTVLSGFTAYRPTTVLHPKKPSHRKKTPFTTLKSGTNIILKKSWEFFVIKIVKHASGVFRLKPLASPCFPKTNTYFFPSNRRIPNALVPWSPLLWCIFGVGPAQVWRRFPQPLPGLGGIQHVQRDTL